MLTNTDLPEQFKPEDQSGNSVPYTSNGYTPITVEEIPDNVKDWFQKETGLFERTTSGLQARGFVDKSRPAILLAFADADFSESVRNPVTQQSSSAITHGQIHNILIEATEFCQSFQNKGFGSIVVTGNDLGGAIAQYAGLACDAQPVTFDSQALPEDLRKMAAGKHLNLKGLTAFGESDIEDILKEHDRKMRWVLSEKEILDDGTTWEDYLLQNPSPKNVIPIFIPSTDRPSSPEIEAHGYSLEQPKRIEDLLNELKAELEENKQLSKARDEL